MVGLGVGLVACGATEASSSISGEIACAEGDRACAAKGDGSKKTTPSAPDGVKNGDESDVDCGGASEDVVRCADGKACNDGSDCESQICRDGACAAPGPDDGVKNGDETDVDCGGKNAPACAVGKGCASHSDCESDACGYAKTCVAVRSCAGHFGGDTCGAGEVGDPAAQHESCCERAPVSDAANATLLDKYVITAGRMRQFIERHDGNLRAFGEQLTEEKNPNWQASWSSMLPASLVEANRLLGPSGHGQKRGCDLNDSRGRTYWMSAEENQALGERSTHPFDKDTLDQKALNCVEFYMLQALCIWDGGRLAKQSEIQAAWQGGERRKWPWGNNADNSRIVHNWNYSFPQVYDQGNFVFVAAPGRRPLGNGKFGHADLAGLLFNMTSDVSGSTIGWSGAGSWETHKARENGALYTTTDISRSYWATGGRCALPR